MPNGNGVDNKTPAQILAQSAAAIRSAKSYEVTAVIHKSGGVIEARIVDRGPSMLRFTIKEAAGVAQLTLVPSGAYIRANKAFWLSESGTQFTSLANRWIKFPTSFSRAFTTKIGVFAPHTFAMCLSQSAGVVRYANTSVDGKPAVVLGPLPRFSGHKRLAIAATGAPYPIKVTATGPPPAYTGKLDTCHPSRSSNNAWADETFSHYNSAPVITAPKHALNFKSLQTSGSSV